MRARLQAFAFLILLGFERAYHQFKAVIPNLGFVYPQGYKSGHLGVSKKKLNNGGKRQYINSVRQDTSQNLRN